MTDELLPEQVSPAAAGIGRASAILASGTLVSRVLGFVSAAVLAYTLGTIGVAANTFRIANQLPNNIYAIIAGGLLSAILVPQIVRASKDPDGGEKFVNRVVTLGIVAFLGIAVIATVLASPLVHLYASQATDGSTRGLSPADFQLATAFAYWCLPQVLFYALYSLFGEVLNARRVFGPFTWAPVVNNLVAIAGLVAFNLLFHGASGESSSHWSTRHGHSPGWQRNARRHRAGAVSRVLLAPHRTQVPPGIPLARRGPRQGRSRGLLDLLDDPGHPACGHRAVQDRDARG